MKNPAASTSATPSSAPIGESAAPPMAAGALPARLTSPALAQLTPMVLDRPEAAGVLRIGVTKLDELLADPTLAFPRLRVGDRVLIPTEALREWITQRAKHDTPAPRDLSKIALTPSKKNRRSHPASGSGVDAQ